MPKHFLNVNEWLYFLAAVQRFGVDRPVRSAFVGEYIIIVNSRGSTASRVKTISRASRKIKTLIVVGVLLTSHNADVVHASSFRIITATTTCEIGASSSHISRSTASRNCSCTKRRRTPSPYKGRSNGAVCINSHLEPYFGRRVVVVVAGLAIEHARRESSSRLKDEDAAAQMGYSIRVRFERVRVRACTR